MKRFFSAFCLIVFTVGLVCYSGCGKGDKAMLMEQMKLMNEFVKTEEYAKIRKDPSALGQKAEEFAKKAGFKDYMECIKAKQGLMSDQDIDKLDREQIQLDAKWDK